MLAASVASVTAEYIDTPVHMVEGHPENLEDVKAIKPKDQAIKIATDLRVNGQQIIQEVSAGVDGYHHDMGEAVAKTVLGGAKMPNTFLDNIAFVLKGTTEAFGANFSSSDILACV